MTNNVRESGIRTSVFYSHIRT